jgi:hypothetical protein
MVTASGPRAWGMIASGQAVGAIAAVAIAWGWGMSGPAAIARAGAQGRITEYASSVACKLVIAPPICAIAFGVAWVVAREHGVAAGVGALSTATVGLTANWYFVGLGRPYALLLGETLPRIVGTVIGIVLMQTGSQALIGVLWQLIGMLGAFVACSLWILAPWDRARRHLISVRPIRETLWAQRHGFTATILTSIYGSAPIILVAVLAPGLQPEYAVLDKVQRQVLSALAPFTVVMQGWVPQRDGTVSPQRKHAALLMSAASGTALLAVMVALSHLLVRWLGNGAIDPGWLPATLTALLTGVFVFEQTISKAILPALGRVSAAARATAIGGAVGLAAVVIGLQLFGVAGAMAGVLCGVIVRAIIGLRASRQTGGEPVIGVQAGELV